MKVNKAVYENSQIILFRYLSMCIENYFEIFIKSSEINYLKFQRLSEYTLQILLSKVLTKCIVFPDLNHFIAVGLLH